MRAWLAVAAGAALLGGCSLFERDAGVTPQPAVYALPPATAWMLITPPEDPAVAAIREAMETLPERSEAASDRLASAAERDAAHALLAELEAQPTARDKARALVERSVHRDAPVASWRQVRRFQSAERCHETRKELQAVTREASNQIDYRPDMPMWRLEWAFLEWSNRWSQCVPVDVVSG